MGQKNANLGIKSQQEAKLAVKNGKRPEIEEINQLKEEVRKLRNMVLPLMSICDLTIKKKHETEGVEEEVKLDGTNLSD